MPRRFSGRFLRLLGAASAGAILLGAAAHGATSAEAIPANVQTFSNLACYGGNGDGHVLTCWRTATGFTVVLPEFKAANKPFVHGSYRGRKVVLVPGTTSATLLYLKTWRSANGDFKCKASNSLFDAHLLCSNRGGKGFDLGPLTYRAR